MTVIKSSGALYSLVAFGCLMWASDDKAVMSTGDDPKAIRF